MGLNPIGALEIPSFLIIVYRVFKCSVTGNLFRLCFQKELLLK